MSDWIKCYNAKHDRDFWKNSVTGETTWKDPTKLGKKSGDEVSVASVAVSVISAASNGEDDGGEWVQGFNDKHKRKFWKNSVTGKVVWTAPVTSSTAVLITAANSVAATVAAQAAATGRAVVHAAVVKSVALVSVTSSTSQETLSIPPVPTTRYLLQLRGSAATDLELNLMQFTEAFLMAQCVGGIATPMLITEQGTTTRKSFKLGGIISIICNQVNICITVCLTFLLCTVVL